MLVSDLLDYWARATPDAHLARDDRRTITYQELRADARQLGRILVERGVIPGDRVAVLATNSIELLLGYFGAAYAGAAWVPVNTRLAAEERRYIIHNSGARVVLALADVLDDGDLHDLEPITLVLRGSGPHNTVPVEEMVRVFHSDADLPVIDADFDAFQVYTSGTTGRPKGAVITHAAALANWSRWQMMGIRLDPGDQLHLSLPANLAAGMYVCMNAIYNGACIQLEKKFDAKATLTALECGAAATSLVPTMISSCLQVEGGVDRNYPRLKWILTGAAPISVQLLRRAIERFDCGFFQGFGQTEAPNVTMLTPWDHQLAITGRPEILETVGKVQPGVEVRLEDSDGAPVQQGHVGEICVRADSVMRGYWQDDSLTHDTQRGGWHHTGDVGVFDGDGYLRVVDRIKDMIITGGFNVYAREIERVIETMAEVAQVAVIGVPHEHWGEEVRAIVELNSKSSLSGEDILQVCRRGLAGYKVPKAVDFVDDMPLSANGKILKLVLRERYSSV
ncbi:class I adenylate-forming enzyme family protein [Mycobacterium sp. NPDC003449]